ncbi:UDP-2,4-diacetamido-2,4,6-trideoxy-beta-L-altropyranose hydrolase [Ferrimonas senticii]|uniref:UDP-2,4-diacetamido-2,4, 6-trideoxy-beta-L-altropyranose hydrolase n=1 Tax=Ferrimonas senticii TaxID=394566 RepID=UPI00042262CA|nr:UDP-2,4-diacetamido-2,4,6-trideoxy-beta-L-altropyranose hydrolase [Ferrimonas senticii]
MAVALFRVDASTQMGCGHVYRCLTLAQSLRGTGLRCHFVCREHAGHLGALITANGFELTLLPPSEVSLLASERQPYQQWLGASWQQDAQQTLAVVDELGIAAVELLVVDHYGLDARWQQLLRRRCRRILVLDDLADRPLDADWVLDQTFGRQAEDYRHCLRRSDAQVLAGAEYALLRPEFAQLRSQALARRQQPLAIPRLLLTLGGADPENHSATVLRSLAEAFRPQQLAVDLVIGASNPHVTELAGLVERLPLSVQLHVATSRMAELMVAADLAIGAAGTTSWERCVLGLPTLTLCLADNQRQVLANLAQCGAIAPLAIDALAEPKALKRAIEATLQQRHEMQSAAVAITDGLGVKRVLMALLSEPLRDGRALQIRFGTAADCKTLFDWQCAPPTRRFARHPEPPLWQQHQHWYQQKLLASDALLAFMTLDDEPVGMLRLDPVAGTDQHEISVLVSPNHYRLGIAQAGLKLLRRLYPECHLLATVLAGNAASHGLFQRLGYQPISPQQYQLLPQELIE